MSASRAHPDYLYYLIYGSGYIDSPWSHIWGRDDYDNDHWQLFVRPTPWASNVGLVDMSNEDVPAISIVKTKTYTYNGLGNLVYAEDGGVPDMRTADRLSLDHHDVGPGAAYKLALQDVEFVDAPVDQETHLEIITKYGFTTDGTLASITMNVGHQEITFTGAARDSTIFMGQGYDKIAFVDHLDVPGQQYWSVIRRPDGELDVYSLFSGYRVQLGGGYKGWTANDSSIVNYGEIEEISLMDASTGGTVTYLPGVHLPYDPNGINNRGTATNIDLRSDGQLFSDSFNLAYFNFIRYTSDNVWAGEATIHNDTLYSTPSDRTVTTAKYGVDAPMLSGTMSVVGQSRNGTHDLIVAEQAAGKAIDGYLRLYAFDVDSGLYNQFNQVFLGTAAGESVSKSTIKTSNWSDRVALYGFGGDDVLTGGAGHDYLFGGQSTYNQLVSGAVGNFVTGGAGADYFGVGNTDAAGALSGGTSVLASGWGDFRSGFATDVIMDWHAGTDTLVVLLNGVAVIGGLYGITGMAGNNTIDLRATAAVATSDQDADGARGGPDYRSWDANSNLTNVFENQGLRDANSITSEAGDITVVNNGLIVARGLEGDDTLFDSPGNDYLYGNASANRIVLSSGGADRVYVDQFDGGRSKHYVEGFTISTGTSTDTDLVMLNKRVIDAFGGNASRATLTQNVVGDYAGAQGYNSGLNFLHDSFYNPSIAAPNSVHESEDGRGLFLVPVAPSGSDGTSGFIGLGMTIVGRALLAVPFVGPIIGGALIATGTLLGGAGNVIQTTPHRNATYDGLVDGYLNVLTDTGSTALNGVMLEPNTSFGNNDTTVQFLDFFQGADAGDGYIPVVEFTQHSNQSMYGYFALHSDDETFVYLVASRDNLVENSEAILVAQVNGRLRAADFRIYDGEQDIYNYAATAPVVLRDPLIEKIADTDGNEGHVDGRIDNALNPIVITGTVGGSLAADSYFRVYDGSQKIFDGKVAVAGQSVSFGLDVTNLNSPVFTFTDSRALGTTVRNTTNSAPVAGNTTGDDTFVLSDTRVRYTVELVDGVTGIPTRVSARDITISGGNGVINGGDGQDLLLITETSAFVNGLTDTGMAGIETISLVASPISSTSVTIVAGVVTGISFAGNSGSGLQDGTYAIAISDEPPAVPPAVSGSGAVATVTVSGGSIVSATVTNGGSNYKETTQALFTPGISLNLSGQLEDFQVIGGSGMDTIIGGSGHDTIHGLGGRDVLDGGAKNDTFVYATLADLFASGALIDSVTGGNDTDTIRIDQDTAFTLAGSDSFARANAVETIAVGAANAGNISITLNADAFTIAGIRNVTLAADTNAAGTNTINAGAQTNGSIGLSLTGSAGEDIIVGGAGNDMINGGSGNDTIASGGGRDTIYGDSGNDDIRWENGVGSGILVYGGDGNDVIDAIAGDVGNDLIFGEGGDDQIWGGGGDDAIYAGAGNDTIMGGSGADVVILTSDTTTQDRIVYNFRDANGSPANKMAADGPAAGADTGYDIISNFDFGSSDKIDVTTFLTTRILDETYQASSLVVSTADNETSMEDNQAMLVVMDSAVGSGAGLTSRIAAVLDEAFDMSSLGEGEDLFFAVCADNIDGIIDTSEYWFGVYRNLGSNDDVVAEDIQVLALIGGVGANGVFDGDNLTAGYVLV